MSWLRKKKKKYKMGEISRGGGRGSCCEKKRGDEVPEAVESYESPVLRVLRGGIETSPFPASLLRGLEEKFRRGKEKSSLRLFWDPLVLTPTQSYTLRPF